jgi:lipopolysaccharide exporter
MGAKANAPMLQALIGKLKGSEIVRGVAVLASGTAVAQFVIIATAPILTRLFSPEDYGILGLVVSNSALLALVATLRYDQALLLERDGDSASHLFVLVLVWSVLLSVAASAVGAVLTSAFDPDSAADVYRFLPWIGVLTLVTAVNMVLSTWAIRQKRYRNIAASQILVTATTVAVQLTAGLLGVGIVGLLGGQIAGATFAVVVLGVLAYRSGAFAMLRDFDLRAQWAMAKKHYRFPLYSMPTGLLERGSKRLPVFLLTLFFSPVEAGYYWLCFRLVTLPVRLIGENSRKPYYNQALDLHARGESIAPLFWKTTGALAMFAIPMAGGMILLAPTLFEVAFGEAWQRAGQYAQWLTVATVASTLNMPCLELAPIFRRQGQVLAFQTAHALVRALALVIGGLLADDLLAIALFAISSCVMSIVMIGYFWRLVGTNSQPGMVLTPSGISHE